MTTTLIQKLFPSYLVFSDNPELRSISANLPELGSQVILLDARVTDAIKPQHIFNFYQLTPVTETLSKYLSPKRVYLLGDIEPPIPLHLVKQNLSQFLEDTPSVIGTKTKSYRYLLIDPTGKLCS